MIKRVLACFLCSVGAALSGAACNGSAARIPPTPTPTQIIVSTPFTLPPSTPEIQPVGDLTHTAPGVSSSPAPTRLPAYSKTLFITPVSPATQVPGLCNQAAPGNPIDVTVPDYTELRPGESFNKTWRLVNASPCTWSADFAAVWFSGEQFGAPQVVSLGRPVESGASVDISVGMTAPEEAGSYQSNWKLSSDQGDLFGIGPAGDSPIWVRIVVVEAGEPAATPSPQPTPTPAILVSGTIALLPAESLDLDTNTVKLGPESDLSYAALPGFDRQLVPANTALLGSLLPAQPEFVDCSLASLSSASLPLPGDFTGRFFCYRTSLGLPGRARLAGLDPATGALTLDILTWTAP